MDSGKTASRNPRNLFAKENQFNAEGKDIQNMAIFNSLVKPFVPETDEVNRQRKHVHERPGK